MQINTELLRQFREKCSKGGVIGPFMKSLDTAFVEAAGFAGCDFAILDREHGLSDYEKLQDNIRGAQLAGMLPVVRVPQLSEVEIAKALDAGAAAVQIPQITSAEDAREAVRAAKYYPKGERGVCRFARAAHYSTIPREQYFKQANDTLVILQIEGRDAIQNLDAILEVEGFDILFIGPYDLSQSMEVPGQTSHPDVVAAMRDVVAKAREHGILVGTFVDDHDKLVMWHSAGVQYLSYSVDVGIFGDACSSIKHKFMELQ